MAIALAQGSAHASLARVFPGNGGTFIGWVGNDDVCHLGSVPLTGINHFAPNNHEWEYTGLYWDCRTNGKELWNSTSFPSRPTVSVVPVGSTVDIRKLDTEDSSSGRVLSRVRWDVGDDGVTELDDSGPWVTEFYGSVRCSLIKFSHTFNLVGNAPLRVTADYDNGTAEMATTVIPVVPDVVTATLAQPAAARPREQSVQLDASGSTALSGVISSYAWDLDGNGSFETPGGATQAISFSTLGAHTVSVRVTSRGGSVDTATTQVDVVPDAVTARLTGPGGYLTAGVDKGEFSAKGSTALSGDIASYEWDLDGNGTFETQGGAAQVRSFAEPGDHTVSVRVTSRGGGTDIASARVNVAPEPPEGDTGISINDGAQFTNSPNVTISLVWTVGSTLARLSNDGGFKGALNRDLSASVPWRLQSSGPERLPKTVYVRFGGPLVGGFGTATFQDDIILDETPPTVSQASLTGASARSAAGRAVVAKTRAYRLKIKAADKTSGVAGMQITSDKRKPGKVLRYSTKATFKTTKSSVYVRAKDRAGNFSKWRTARK